jgi:amino acid adenylation domain-containing protein
MTAEAAKEAARERNATAPQTDCIHTAFEAQARRTPERVALQTPAGSLTYVELDRRASELACQLRAVGVGLEELVGIALPRGGELVVAVLATLKAGGAYVPLDPAYPKARLAQIVDDASPRAIVTVSSLRSSLPLGAAHVVCLDAPSAAATSAVAGAGPENAAYVIYTSGSTGTPKGVTIEHRNVANFFAGMDDVLDVQAGGDAHPGVWLAGTSLSFDISVLELLWTLTRGFSVVIQPEEDKAGSFASMVAAHGATHFQCTPSMATLLAADAESRRALGRLRVMLVGGEALSPALARELVGALRGPLFNMYGPTETTVWSTSWRVDGAALARGEPMSIGLPLVNTTLHVLDPAGAPVPAGKEGELWIGGAGVSRGYLRRPELTAERFVQDGGGRRYRTGDLVRALADGRLEFLGRLDHQVKIRGHRIELGEIELALREVAGVREVVVVAQQGDAADQRLVAYIGGAAPASGDLRRLLRQRLPEPMIPSAFVVLERLPLTPNGKIDRKALPPPGAVAPPPEGGDVQDDAFVAPRTPTEQVIAAIWCEVLGLPRVSVFDNFFELGGHSLLSPKVMEQIEKRLGKRLNVAELFLQNLRQVAARCDGASAPRGLWAAFTRMVGRG